MTEEQLEALNDLGNDFWHEFSDLCNKYIGRAEKKGLDPDYATMYLGEKTSIYGRRRQKG